MTLRLSSLPVCAIYFRDFFWFAVVTILKLVSRLAVIYKIFYGFHIPFVILDNWTLGGFQLLTYFTVRLFHIFIVIYRRNSITEGRVSVSQFHDQTTSKMT